MSLHYRFWKPIEYYSTTDKFTHGICQNGILLNIDWDTGNQFTVNIWNVPDGFWKNVQEIKHNVIRPRKIPRKPEDTEYMS